MSEKMPTAVPGHEALNTVASARRVEIPEQRSGTVERDLFKDGVFRFDPETIDQQLSLLPKHRDHSTDGVAQREINARATQFDREWATGWMEHFSGVVPAHWGRVDARLRPDFISAIKACETLSPDLLEAAVTHPSWQNAVDAAETQRLPRSVLMSALYRDMPRWARERVIEGQAKLGVNKVSLWRASKKAEKLRRQTDTPGYQEQTMIANREKPFSHLGARGRRGRGAVVSSISASIGRGGL